MNNSSFEEQIKALLFNSSEPTEQGGWDKLSADLAVRAQRRSMGKRLLFSASVAAAILVLAIILWPPAPDIRPNQTSIAVLDSAQVSATEKSTEQQDIKTLEKETYKAVQTRQRQKKRLTAQETAKDTAKADFRKEVPAQAPAKTTVADTNPISEPSKQQQTRKPVRPYTDPFQEIHRTKKRSTKTWSLALNSGYGGSGGSSPFSTSTQELRYAKTAHSVTYVSSNNVSVNPTEEASAFQYSPPISIGLDIQKQILPWLSIGAGLNYTFLQSKFSSPYMGTGVSIKQQLHYVGIPVSVRFLFVNQPKFGVYASIGGSLEKAISAQYISSSGVGEDIENGSIDPLQWSMGAGLGIEYFFSKIFGIYLEPEISHYFDCNQPNSIRTVQPTQFKLELGLRVRI